MRSYNQTRQLLLLMLVLTTGATPALYGQSRPPRTEREKFDKDEFNSQFPITDYIAAEPRETEELAKRRAVGKRYDNAVIPVSEHGDTIFSSVDWEAGLPALPVNRSQAIITGQVVDARAYLSNDKTGIYSEFSVRVDEVLKSGGHVPLAVGGLIVADRSGGRVRFPSGHVILSFTRGQSMPRIGRRYVLFLTRDELPQQNFHLLTGYELRDGRVALLDNPGAGTHPIAKYDGIGEMTFLNGLREAITNSPSQVRPD